MAIDRSAVSQALRAAKVLKAIIYKECGKDTEAAQWAIKLVQLLELANILK